MTAQNIQDMNDEDSKSLGHIHGDIDTSSDPSPIHNVNIDEVYSQAEQKAIIRRV